MHPRHAVDRTGRGPARVLVVGHQADQVGVFAQRRQVVGTAPVLPHPLGELALASMPRCVGHHGDGQLQPVLVQRLGGLLGHQRVGVAIGPGNALEVELEAGVAVLLGLLQHRLDHVLLGRFVVQQVVKALATGGHRDDRHHRQLVLLGQLQHVCVRRTVDQAFAVDAVPGRHQQADLVDMGDHRVDRLLRVHHVEQRRRLGMRRTADEHGGEKPPEESFHGWSLVLEWRPGMAMRST